MLAAAASRGIFTYKKVFPFFVSGPLGTETFAAVAMVSTVGREVTGQEVESTHRFITTILDVATTHHSLEE